MQIQSSTVALQSKNSAYSLYKKTEQLQVGVGGTNGSGTPQMGLSISRTEIKEQKFLSSLQTFSQQSQGSSLQDDAYKLADELRKQNNQRAEATAPNEKDPYAIPLKDKMKLYLLVQLLNRFQADPQMLKDLGLDDESMNKAMAAEGGKAEQASAPSSQSASPPRPAAVVEYSAHETLYQSETAQFSAQAQVQTSDGKSININLNLLMDRQTLESSDVKLRLQAATKDPLVINLDGSAAQLSDQQFTFDLSSNGKKDTIAQLAGNRAFLALDKNSDGVINNGSELFGAKTGDGFKELAQYDQDKNGWIDENDSVFKDLKLWMNAGTEQQKLVGLKEANIGALYTGSAKTTMHLQSTEDSQKNLGVIQATGLFLKEDGSAGTIQHVDLAV